MVLDKIPTLHQYNSPSSPSSPLFSQVYLMVTPMTDREQCDRLMSALEAALEA